MADYGQKIAEVRSCCMEGDSSHLSSVEKMRDIERHLSMIFQELDEMPKDLFQQVKKHLNMLKNSRFVSLTADQLMQTTVIVSEQVVSAVDRLLDLPLTGQFGVKKRTF